MQNVLPLIFPEPVNRYTDVHATWLSDAEQQSIVQLAIQVLELRHQPGQALTSPDRLRDYLRLKLADRKNEVFGVVFLDTKHRIIIDEELFRGTINTASVYPRVVVQKALEYNCSAVLFYHNHPSGDPEPGDSDVSITRKLVKSLQLFDVRVLDHLVIGSEGTVSFAERGLL